MHPPTMIMHVCVHTTAVRRRRSQGSVNVISEEPLIRIARENS